jgi:hypothetical protein
MFSGQELPSSARVNLAQIKSRCRGFDNVNKNYKGVATWAWQRQGDAGCPVAASSAAHHHSSTLLHAAQTAGGAAAPYRPDKK